MTDDATHLRRRFLTWLLAPHRPISLWLPKLSEWSRGPIEPRQEKTLREVLAWIGALDPQAAFFIRYRAGALGAPKPRSLYLKRPYPKRFQLNFERLMLQLEFQRGSLQRGYAYVDPSTSRIFRDGRWTFSPAIALGIERLHQGPPISAAELMRQTYGVTYDGDIHQEKLFSLLARMRPLLGKEVKIFYRDGVIYNEGSWKHVRILTPPEWSRVLQDSVEWRSFLENLRPTRRSRRASVNSRLLFNQVSERGAFRRTELEALGSISRSSAHRLIQRWILKGLIRPKREGRIVVYRLSPNLTNRRTNPD